MSTSYIPPTSDPRGHDDNIWAAPSQRMPTDQLRNSTSTSTSTSFASYPAIDLNIEPSHHDVFGPVASNGHSSMMLSTRPGGLGVDPKKSNVGAIGDRRKKDDGNVPRSHTTSVQESPDPASVFAVTQLLRSLEFPSPFPTEQALPIRHPQANKPFPQFPLEESPSGSSSSSCSPGMFDILQTPSDSSPIVHRSSNSLGAFSSSGTDHTARNVKMPFGMGVCDEGYSGQFSGRSLDPAPFSKGLPLLSNQLSNSIYDSPSDRLLASYTSNQLSSLPLEKSSASPQYNPLSQLLSNTYQGSFNPFENESNGNAGPSPAQLQGHMRLRSELLVSGSMRVGGMNGAKSTWPFHNQSQDQDQMTSMGSGTLGLGVNVGLDKPRPLPTPGYVQSPPFGTPAPPSTPSIYYALSASTSGSMPRHTNANVEVMRNGVPVHAQLEQQKSTQTSPFPAMTLQELRQQQQHQQQHAMPTRMSPMDLGARERHAHSLSLPAPLPSSRQPIKPRLPGPIDDRSPQHSPVYHTSLSTPHLSDISASSLDKPSTEPINFLHLLSPGAAPPYSHFINRIIKSSDQQASIFLQQKLKIADAAERKKIIDAVAQRGVEMMTNRFGNWAVQRCLEPPCELSDRMKIVHCMRGHVVELATNCYGTHVLQKALDCEEDIRLFIVSELLLGDPSSTLLNKHSAHVWSKIMELTWTHPAPPIFAYVNKSLAGKWASLACHETGSLVVQTAFEQCEERDKDIIIDELLDESAFSELVMNSWGLFCVLHLLEHGAPHHKARAIDNLVNGLTQYASHEQSLKAVVKALKEGGTEVLDRVVAKLCEPPKGGRRPSLVDISLSPVGSQLVGTILPSVNKEQRSALYEAIRGHVVTLRGSRVGSKVIWLFDRMRAYYGY